MENTEFFNYVHPNINGLVNDIHCSAKRVLEGCIKLATTSTTIAAILESANNNNNQNQNVSQSLHFPIIASAGLVPLTTKTQASDAPAPTATATTTLYSMPEKPEELAPVISYCLVQMTLGHVLPPPSVFDCPLGTVPSITISKYIERIAAKTRASPEALLLAVILLDRMAKIGLAPSSGSIFRMYAACFVIAAKMQDDKYYSNKYYARVAGVPLPELNVLERSALNILGFNLIVHLDEWLAYANPVSQIVYAQKQQQFQRQLLQLQQKHIVMLNSNQQQQQQQQQQQH